jgi:Arc/MetJ-type ribon-helix-helix transcriptional regulator
MVRIVARRQVLVQLDDTQVERLDRFVGSDASRSELIREAIDLYLAALAEGLEDVRYAEAYRRVPEDLAEDTALRTLALEAWPPR